MITIIPESEIEQGSEEWLELRANYITGTNAIKVLQGYSIEEVLVKKQQDLQKHWGGNYYTKRGHELEEIGIDLYSRIRKVPVDRAGFVLNSKYPRAGYSPDGLIGEEGVVEHKAFNEKRHFEVYKNLDPAIIAQIQFGLFVTERSWCDLILFNPDVENIADRFLVQRILPEPTIQAKLEKVFQNP